MSNQRLNIGYSCSNIDYSQSNISYIFFKRLLKNRPVVYVILPALEWLPNHFVFFQVVLWESPLLFQADRLEFHLHPRLMTSQGRWSDSKLNSSLSLNSTSRLELRPLSRDLLTNWQLASDKGTWDCKKIKKFFTNLQLSCLHWSYSCFYVVFVPLEYIPSITLHSTYIIIIRTFWG